jgi:hypothetical protein
VTELLRSTAIVAELNRVLPPTMSTQPRYTGREEVERLPTDNSDLENGALGRGDTAGGMNDGGEDIKSVSVMG